MKRIWLSFALVVAACGPGSINHLCDEAAVAQCERCYSCELDGAALCDLDEGTSQEECVDEVIAGCVDQAATVEEAKIGLRDCTASLETLTCEMLVGSEAQGGPTTTEECEYYL